MVWYNWVGGEELTLKELRESKGYSQELLAQKSGVSKSTIATYEQKIAQGIHREMRSAQRKAICRALKCKEWGE